MTAAVGFAARQPDVRGGRVAALGLSMGAELALSAAASGAPLRAVIADGAEGSTLGDQRAVGLGALETSVNWLGMRAVEVFSGDNEPQPLNEQVRAVRIPVLLIASPREREADSLFERRIGRAHAQLWYVPDAGHTDALGEHPRAYAARVAGFLRRALR